jgi:RNA polymerase sigma factor (sigma-70 family)
MSSQIRMFGGTKRITAPMTRRSGNDQLVQALSVHAGLILSSAARVLGSMDEAQDVAQDMAEKLLRKPPKDVRSWPAFLKTMAVNAAIDRYRRRRESTDSPEQITHEGPETVLSQVEKADALRNALGELSQRDANMFSFYYLADLSHADIGRQLEMNSNAVGVALHRIRQRLGALLQPTVNPFDTGEPQS